MFICKFLITIISVAYTAVVCASSIQVKMLPYPVVCKPVSISWSGGSPPYSLSINKDDCTSGVPYINFGNIGNFTSFTWIVNVTADTVVSALVTDSTGASNFSSPVSVEANYYTGCINTVNIVVTDYTTYDCGSTPTSSSPNTTPTITYIDTTSSPAPLTSTSPTTSALPPLTTSYAMGLITATVNSTIVTTSTITTNSTSTVTAKPTSGASLVEASIFTASFAAVVAFFVY